MPDVEEPARFVCQVPSVVGASVLISARQVVIYQLVDALAFVLFVFEKSKIRRGRPGEAQLRSAQLHGYVVESPVRLDLLA